MLYNIKLSLTLPRVFHGIRFYISKKAVGRHPTFILNPTYDTKHIQRKKEVY